MINHKPAHYLWSLAPLVIGLVAFLAITGGRIVWPQNVDWLLSGDPATHWLGWQFFRHTPLIQWPMGANRPYGMEIGSSIVFSDSIPIMAFIFKPFSALLPDKFQYIGIWVLVCFMLQSWFAMKLLALITSNRLLALTACAFFTIAPVYLARLGFHYALFGQWVIVAALYFYWSMRFSVLRWAALLSIAALIHAYLLAMVMVIGITDLVQRIWIRQLTLARAGAYLLAGFSLVALVMWGAGYFMLKAGVQSGGFGFFRMNALALIDSNGVWSSVLPDEPNMPGDYEGFSFLGLGLILLGVVACAVFILKKGWVNNPRWIPLAVASVSLLVFALSDHIAIGANESFQYSLPAFTKPITDTFRVSGRFIWPVYYVLFLAVFYQLFSHLKSRTATLLCCIALVVQIVDSRQAWQNINALLNDAPKWESPLRSPVWQELGQRYKKLVYVLPSNNPKPWLELSEFAAAHHMAINIGYFARTNPQVESATRDALINAIAENKIDADTLYIFENAYLRDVAARHKSEHDLPLDLDGYHVLAPAFPDCARCGDAVVDALAKTPRFSYSGGPITFASDGNAVPYQLFGWGAPEPWGSWSDGKIAALRLELHDHPASDLQLLIKGHAFVNDKVPVQTIQVSVNGEVVGSLRFAAGEAAEPRSVRIPAELIARFQGNITIKFKFEDAVAPSSVGVSADPRVLAFAFESIEIRDAPLRL